MMDLLAGMGMAIGAGLLTVAILSTIWWISQKRRGIR